MKLVISKHARIRMYARNITDNDILRSLEHPKTRKKQDKAIVITSNWIGKMLRIAYIPFEGGAFIKTVLWET